MMDKQESRSFITWVKTSPMGSVLVLGVVALVVLAAVWGVAAARSGGAKAGSEEGLTDVEGATAVQTPDSDEPAPKIGEPAPLFTASTVSGQQIDLESLRGKPVWLVFNATWCADCRAELPDIEAAQEQYGDKIEIVGIYLSDSESVVADYAERLNLTFPQIADPGNELGALYRVMGVPTHYFIDAAGDVVGIDVGTLSPKLIEDNLGSLLASP